MLKGALSSNKSCCTRVSAPLWKRILRQTLRTVVKENRSAVVIFCCDKLMTFDSSVMGNSNIPCTRQPCFGCCQGLCKAHTPTFMETDVANMLQKVLAHMGRNKVDNHANTCTNRWGGGYGSGRGGEEEDGRGETSGGPRGCAHCTIYSYRTRRDSFRCAKQ
jgi:hypothetical protein